jgi:hypothetical protein
MEKVQKVCLSGVMFHIQPSLDGVWIFEIYMKCVKFALEQATKAWGRVRGIALL